LHDFFLAKVLQNILCALCTIFGKTLTKYFKCLLHKLSKLVELNSLCAFAQPFEIILAKQTQTSRPAIKQTTD